jgi:hypothetical protein
VNYGKIKALTSFQYAFIFFLVTQLVIFTSLGLSSVTQVLLYWSCNNFSFFLAVACYRRDMQMLMGVSYLGLLAQLLWGVDFISHLLGFNLSSVSDYIFYEGFTYANDVSIGLHLVVPIVVLALSLKTKPHWQSLVYAGLYSLGLYVVTLLMTSAIDDVNCVYQGCSLGASLSYHVYEWPLYAAGLILGAFFVHMVLYRLWLRLEYRNGPREARAE